MANSEYLRDLIMRRTFLDKDALPNLFIGLHSGDSSQSGKLELDDYNRQPVEFDSNSRGTITNRNALQFDDMPAATVTYFSVWNASAEGDYLTGGPLDIGLIVSDGRSVRWREGELTLTIG